MKKYHDTSIFNLTSLRRGYKLGKRGADMYRSSMVAGHSFELFQDLYEVEAKRHAAHGLVSPIGEVVGWLFSPKDLYTGMISAKRQTRLSNFLK